MSPSQAAELGIPALSWGSILQGAVQKEIQVTYTFWGPHAAPCFIKHLVLLRNGEGEIQTAHTSCKCPSPAVGRLKQWIWVQSGQSGCVLKCVPGHCSVWRTQSSQTMVAKSSG